MTLNDANELVEKNSHLVGKSLGGGRIDEIIIYPTDPDFLCEFKKTYVATRNSKESISRFSNCDVNVGVIVDTFLIDENAFLNFYKLSEIDDDLSIIL